MKFYDKKSFRTLRKNVVGEPLIAIQESLPHTAFIRRGAYVGTSHLIAMPTVSPDKYKIQVVIFGGANENEQNQKEGDGLQSREGTI